MHKTVKHSRIDKIFSFCRSVFHIIWFDFMPQITQLKQLFIKLSIVMWLLQEEKELRSKLFFKFRRIHEEKYHSNISHKSLIESTQMSAFIFDFA